ncbi:MAG TPA: hypothetical protein DCW46_00840 [Desulfotomaculum sp.]|nr:hypothetical protein [Desulfotomaculum sp.]
MSKPFGQYGMASQLPCIFAAGLIRHFLNDSIFIIENMLTWYHSGFNVYCGESIWPSDREGVEKPYFKVNNSVWCSRISRIPTPCC